MDCFSTYISTLHLKKPFRTGIDGNKRPQTNSLISNVLIMATTTNNCMDSTFKTTTEKGKQPFNRNSNDSPLLFESVGFPAGLLSLETSADETEIYLCDVSSNLT